MTKGLNIGRSDRLRFSDHFSQYFSPLIPSKGLMERVKEVRNIRLSCRISESEKRKDQLIVVNQCHVIVHF